MLEHLDEIDVEVGLVAVAVAGGEEHHLAAGLGGRRRGCREFASGELLAGAVGVVVGHRRVDRDTERGVEQFAAGLGLVDGIDGLRDDRDAGDRADHIGGREDLVAEAHFALLGLHGLGAQHQVREIEVPRVRRHIRALRHVAHVTEVTVVHDIPVSLLVDGVELAGGRFVDGVEQGGERVAEREAAAAAVADVEHALQFFVERGLVVERRIPPSERVAGRRFQRSFAAGRDVALAHSSLSVGSSMERGRRRRCRNPERLRHRAVEPFRWTPAPS